MRDDDGGVFRETTRAQTHHLSIIPNILVGWAKKLTRNGDPYPFYDDGAIDRTTADSEAYQIYVS